MDNKNLMFVVLAILVLGFFSTGLNRYTGGAVTPEVSLENAYCDWKFDNFEACVTVNWNGMTGDYAKAEITGGESIESSPEQYESPFTYCTDVGTYEGKRAPNVFIHDYRGRVKSKSMHHDNIICKKLKNRPKGDLFNDYVTFTAQRTSGRAEGVGEKIVKLPKNPVSCEITGNYRMTRIDPRKYLNKVNLDCTGTGSFYAYVDKSGQRGTDDADLFRWGDESLNLYDPPQRDYEGSIAEIYSCNRKYLTDINNHVTVRVKDFSKNMKLEWEYHDDYRRPSVDVMMDINCELEQDIVSGPRAREPIVKEEIIEIPVEEAEPFVEEEPTTIVPQVKRTFMQRLKEAFRVLFNK